MCSNDRLSIVSLAISHPGSVCWRALPGSAVVCLADCATRLKQFVIRFFRGMQRRPEKLLPIRIGKRRFFHFRKPAFGFPAPFATSRRRAGIASASFLAGSVVVCHLHDVFLDKLLCRARPVAVGHLELSRGRCRTQEINPMTMTTTMATIICVMLPALLAARLIDCNMARLLGGMVKEL